jgi:hypothetical protein
VVLTPSILAPGAIERRHDAKMGLLEQQLQDTHNELYWLGLDPNNLPPDPGLTAVLPSDQRNTNPGFMSRSVFNWLGDWVRIV